MSGILKLRTAQKEFVRGVERHRLCAFVARRQFGKTTTLASIALKRMMKTPGHTVVFGSAKLNLSREIVRKEAQLLESGLRAMLKEDAAERLQLADAGNGKVITGLSEDDLAAIFEAQRLEFRFYHSRTLYSRTKVVALRPDTVGETGDLFCDEITRVGNWRDVWEAIEPIVSSNPEFRLILSGTPPPDDTHYSFSMLAPAVGAEFPVNPSGNWYKSEMGIPVLRVDAFDAWSDGVPVYDLEKGEPLSPEEHRRRAIDKDAWDRNYGCKFIVGGTAVCGLAQLNTAQTRGIGKALCIVCESDVDFEIAVSAIRSYTHLGAPTGVGFDVATTEKESSNPSVLAIAQQIGVEKTMPLVVVWKTRDPRLATERVRRILSTLADQRVESPARKLCIDATSERLFAERLKEELASLVPVELVIASESVQPPGYQDPVSVKTYLGDLYVGELNDAHLTLPPERYLRDDHRLVKKVSGRYTTDIGPEGQHGDTFDACKLANYALSSPSSGPIMVFEDGRRSQILADRRMREVLA
jgi:hypothetical protein